MTAALQRMTATENNFKNLLKDRFLISVDTKFHDAYTVMLGSSAGMGKSLLMRMVQNFYDSMGFATFYYDNVSFATFCEKARRDADRWPEIEKVFFVDDCDNSDPERFRLILQHLKLKKVHKIFMSFSMHTVLQDDGQRLSFGNKSQHILYGSDVCCILKRNMNDPTILIDYVKHRFLEVDKFVKKSFFTTLFDEYQNKGYDVSAARRLWKFDYASVPTSSFKEIFSV